MTTPMLLWAIALLAVTIVYTLAQKVAANHLPPQTAPIFNFVWLTIGLIVTIPLFTPEWHAALTLLQNNLWLIIPIILKGWLIFMAIHHGMLLGKQSLSAGNFIIPAALTISPLLLFLLGEELTLMQMILCSSLGVMGISFFLRGHLADLNRNAKRSFFLITTATLGMIVCDYIIIQHGNWLLLLAGTTCTQLIFIQHQKPTRQILKLALFSKYALLAGVSVAIFEFIGFYQMGTINPVSITVAIKASALPFTQLAAALIWQERTWQEQLSWGIITALLLAGLALA